MEDLEDSCSEFQNVDIMTLEDLFLTGKIFLEAYKKLKDKNAITQKKIF